MRYFSLIAYLLILPILYLTVKRFPKEDKIKKYFWPLLTIYSVIVLVAFFMDTKYKQLSTITLVMDFIILMILVLYAVKKYNGNYEYNKDIHVVKQVTKEELEKYSLEEKSLIDRLFQEYVRTTSSYNEYDTSFLDSFNSKKELDDNKKEHYITYDHSLNSYKILKLIEREKELLIHVIFDVSFREKNLDEQENKNIEGNGLCHYKYFIEFKKEKGSNEFILNRIELR